MTGKLYIGQTNNINDRIFRHNTNQTLSTKNKGPWKLIFSKEFESRTDAIMPEKKLKAFKNKQRILRWIEINSPKSVPTCNVGKAVPQGGITPTIRFFTYNFLSETTIRLYSDQIYDPKDQLSIYYV